MGIISKKQVYNIPESVVRYQEAGIQNLQLSNEMSGKFQTLIATIVLAELAFLGTLGFDHTDRKISAWAVTSLICALLIFLIAVSLQQIAIQKAAKRYFVLASKLEDHMKEAKITHVDELPEELKISEFPRYIKFANRMLLPSYGLITIGSGLILLLIWRMV